MDDNSYIGTLDASDPKEIENMERILFGKKNS